MKFPWRRQSKSGLDMPGLDMPRLPDRLDRKAVRELREAYANPVMAGCGHLTSRDVIVWLDDECTVTSMSSQVKPEVCGDCLTAMVIRCAWCGRAIFIGDPVTLYSARSGELPELPDRAVVFDQDRATLVGCLGGNCADTGADRVGFWIPDPTNPGHGHVRLHESLYLRAAR